jgi:hypothetical protein
MLGRDYLNKVEYCMMVVCREARDESDSEGGRDRHDRIRCR